MAQATQATLVTFRMDPSREVEQRRALHDMIVPSVRSAPGFVSGTWTLDRDAGESVVLVTFEEIDHARDFAESVRANAPHQQAFGIDLVSLAIVEVVADASVISDAETTVDDIHLVTDEEVDEGTLEIWQRDVDDPDLRSVVAYRIDDDEWPWNVGVAVMEFIRRDPLETELRDALTRRLSAVSGVLYVFNEDREMWRVGGTPSGVELARAAASVVDAFLDRTRAECNSLS